MVIDMRESVVDLYTCEQEGKQDGRRSKRLKSRELEGDGIEDFERKVVEGHGGRRRRRE